MKNYFLILFVFSACIIAYPQSDYNDKSNLFISTSSDDSIVYIKEKSPWLALGLSYLLPGLGQLYNGEPVKGLLAFAGVSAGVGLMLLGAGDFEHESTTEESFFYAGAAIAGLTYLWQVIDAPISASRINRENKSRKYSLNFYTALRHNQKEYGAVFRLEL